MDKKRRGEIAIVVLKRTLAWEGINPRPDGVRNFVAALVKSTGLCPEELTEFVDRLFREIIDEHDSPTK